MLFCICFRLENNKENNMPSRPARSQGIQCSYFNCNNRLYTPLGTRSQFHFFQVPLKSPQKTIWCNRMGKVDGKDGFFLNKHTRICNQHFSEQDVIRVPGGKRWRLKAGALPIKAGQPTINYNKRKAPSFRAPLTGIQKKSKRNPPVNYEAVTLKQPKTLKTLALVKVKSVFDTALEKSKNMEDHCKKLEEELKETKKLLQQKTFTIGIIKDNDDLCKLYTGFPTYLRLKACFDYLSPGEKGENVKLKGSAEKNGNGGRPRALTGEDQFFVALVRLRQGFPNSHIGWLFALDESTITRIVISWLNFMYLRFCSLPIWPTKEQVQLSMPEEFRKRFPNTRVIVDCTEIAVEAPESLHLRSVYYSDYKNHTTYKALIGITPSGGLCFVSELFPGSVSDREIVSRSGLLNPSFWDKDDEIMADKGFNIRDLVDEIGVKLNIPIFLENHDQFTPEEVIVNQSISSLRIHVERYINRVKNFHIFDSPLPITMHGSVNQIFTTCAFLVMFQNPIISA